MAGGPARVWSDARGRARVGFAALVGTAVAWGSLALFGPGTAGADQLSCGSPSLCAIVTNYGLITSTNPTGGPSAWEVTNLPGGIVVEAVSCPSNSLCVGIGYRTGGSSGDVIISSTNPTGGPSAWKVTPVGLSGGDISCPTSSMCVALAANGATTSSTNPSGDASDWQTAHPIDIIAISISCPSPSLCVAVGDNPAAPGNSSDAVVHSTSPTSDSPWQQVPLGTYLLDAACPSNMLCIVGDYNGDIFSSTDPSGDSLAWDQPFGGTATVLSQATCASTSLCLATGVAPSWSPSAKLSLLTSTNPANSGSWNSVFVPDNRDIDATSCPSETLCVLLDRGDDYAILTATNPTGPTDAWSTVELGLRDVEVFKVGSGGGTVTSSPDGLDCGLTCGAVMKSGSVTLSAQPDEGSAFIGWSNGVCSGTGACILDADDFGRVTATFETVPDTSITAGPAEGSLTKQTRHYFDFTSSKEGASFECSLNGEAFAPCSPRERFGFGERNGQHKFEVRATDQFGSRDPTAAVRNFTIDTERPRASITDGPKKRSGDRTPKFKFKSDEENSTFRCSLDGKRAKKCESPYKLKNVSEGKHVFKVTAVDAARNYSRADSFKFVVT